MVNRYLLWTSRARSRAHDDGAGCQLLLCAIDGLHFDSVIIQKVRTTMEQRDAIASKLLAHERIVGLNDLFKTAQECGNVHVWLQAELECFTGPLESIEMEGAFS